MLTEGLEVLRRIITGDNALGTFKRSITCFLDTCELNALRCASKGTAAKSVSTLGRLGKEIFSLVRDMNQLRNVGEKQHERNTTNNISPMVFTSQNKAWHTKAKPPER